MAYTSLCGPPSKFACKNPSWDKLHWVPQAVLFLPKEEGGLQFIQRLLYGPKDLVWRLLAHLVLQQLSGLRLQESLFLLDLKTVKFHNMSLIYRSFFTVWKMLDKQRQRPSDSLHWLLKEPVVHGGRFGPPCWAGAAVTEVFCRAGVITFGSVVNSAGPALDDAVTLTAGLGVRSVRTIKKLLDHWKNCLTGPEHLLLGAHCRGLVIPQPDDPFPVLTVCPRFENCVSPFLNEKKSNVFKLRRAKRKIHV